MPHCTHFLSQRRKAPIKGPQAEPDAHPEQVDRLLRGLIREGSASFRVPAATHDMILELQLDGKFYRVAASGGD